MFDGERPCRVCGAWQLVDDSCPIHEQRINGKIEILPGFVLRGGVTRMLRNRKKQKQEKAARRG